jgi:fructose-bisphosphate aldolase class 1
MNDAAGLTRIATAMVAAGKGILAADESIGTMSARLEHAGVAATEITRLRPAWPVAFSLDGALTHAVLAACRGDPRHVRDVQRALASRVACNVAALRGNYVAALERSYILA